MRLNRLDDIAKPLSTESGQPPTPLIAEAANRAADPLKTFSDNIDHEDHNITLEGEGYDCGNLTKVWSGEELSRGEGRSVTRKKVTSESYLDAYQTLLKNDASANDRASAYAMVQRLSPQVKLWAQKVIDLNFANMTPLEGRAKKMADNATRLLVILTGGGHRDSGDLHADRGAVDPSAAEDADQIVP